MAAPARYVPVDLIEVTAWGRLVGAVAAGRQRDAYVFEYDPAWIAGGIEPRWETAILI